MDNISVRLDYRIIAQYVAAGSTVLDLGCGNGDLLQALTDERGVRGQGIEIDEQAIYHCVEKGLNVLHGDIDSGLADYRDKSFDFVILNQSLQQVRHFEPVLKDALRVGKSVIVGFPNFAHYGARLQLFFFGRAPVTGSLPYTWYETPNIHFLSIRDFIDYCGSRGITINAKRFTGLTHEVRIMPNVFAHAGIFVISK
jgi:methionine biosynthesis protein MetW